MTCRVQFSNGLKGTGGLARAWVAAFNEDPASLARDNIIVQLELAYLGKSFWQNVS